MNWLKQASGVELAIKDGWSFGRSSFSVEISIDEVFCLMNLTHKMKEWVSSLEEASTLFEVGSQQAVIELIFSTSKSKTVSLSYLKTIIQAEKAFSVEFRPIQTEITKTNRSLASFIAIKCSAERSTTKLECLTCVKPLSKSITPFAKELLKILTSSLHSLPLFFQE